MTEFESSGPLRMLDDGFIGIDQKAMFADIVPLLRFWLGMFLVAWVIYIVIGDYLVKQFPAVDVERLTMFLFWVVVGYVGLRGVYMVVAVRYRSYILDNALLHVRVGVFTKVHVMVPRDRVQYTSVSRSFMQRLFELASLSVYTAGTKSGSVGIRHIRNSEAERIQDELVSQMQNE